MWHSRMILWCIFIWFKESNWHNIKVCIIVAGKQIPDNLGHVSSNLSLLHSLSKFSKNKIRTLIMKPETLESLIILISFNFLRDLRLSTKLQSSIVYLFQSLNISHLPPLCLLSSFHCLPHSYLQILYINILFVILCSNSLNGFFVILYFGIF